MYSSVVMKDAQNISALLTADYFLLFDMKQQYELDVHALNQHYFNAQRAFHPDRHASFMQEEKTQLAQIAARINDAYQTLKTPLRRAEYILSLRGIIVNKENATHKPSQRILMEAMEQREALMEANEPDALEYLHIQAQRGVQSCELMLAQAFSDEQWLLAADKTIHLQYLQKFLQEVSHKRAAMGAL